MAKTKDVDLRKEGQITDAEDMEADLDQLPGVAYDADWNPVISPAARQAAKPRPRWIDTTDLERLVEARKKR